MAAMLALAPSAHAGQAVVDAFGPLGSQGGQIGTESRGIAINQTGAGGVAPGTIYVTDEGNNRVQRFDTDGDFERAWGVNVVTGGGTGFEICTIAAACKAGATPSTANGGQLDSPQGIAVNQATGDVYVTEGGARRVSQFDADGDFVRTWGWDVVSAGDDNISSNAFEICSDSAECKQAASSGADGGRFFNNPRSLTVDSAGDLWVADTGNRRIQRFNADGTFVAAYGDDVDANGGSGGLEECITTAPGACKAGTRGDGIGQFGSFSPFFLTVATDGFIYAVDNNNDRLQRFSSTASSAALFGPAISGIGISSPIVAIPGDRLLLGAAVDGHREILELDALGNVIDRHAPEADIAALGLAMNETSGRIYATTSTGRFRLLVLDEPLPAPTGDITAVANVEGTTASATASVDPSGGLLNCSFEYSVDRVTWTAVEAPDCEHLDPNGGSQAINATLTDLEPNTDYTVRLATSRPYVAGQMHSGSEPFTTAAVPPIISGVGAVRISDTSMRLVGRLDPQNSPTSYVFEYGDSPAMESATEPVEIGGGSTRSIVSQRITELSPGTTYHFHLVATGGGIAQSARHEATTRAEPLPLPDDRGYEQVTPPDKNFSDAFTSSFRYKVTVAPSGDAVGFCSPGGFGDRPAQRTAQCGDYVSQRHPDGWRSNRMAVPGCVYDFTEPDTTLGFPSVSEVFPSRDLESATFEKPESAGCPIPPLDADSPLPGSNVYLAEFAKGPVGQRLLTPEPAFHRSYKVDTGTTRAASDDFGHIVYTSTGQQTSDAPAGDFAKIFDAHDGMLTLVSRDPSNAPFTVSSRVPMSGYNSVSTSGDRIFFEQPASGGTRSVYMREDGSTTYEISISECTSDCGPGRPSRFRRATPDGSAVLLTSTGTLTDGDSASSGEDLYLYNHSSDPAGDQNLTLLSGDNEPSDGSSASVQGVLGMSDDGRTVFFVADGQIVEGEPSEAGPKVYRSQRSGGSATVDFLGALSSSGDSSNWQAFLGSEGLNRLVTPGGDFLVLHSVVPLDPVADDDTDADIYRWSEPAGWECVSCQLPGSPSSGDSVIDTRFPEASPGLPPFHTHNDELYVQMSDDGQRIFFDSPDALASEDVNGIRDVYEWHDGTISLISTGQGEDPTTLVGASASGRDVFFWTRQRLVGWDIDNNVDIYTARTGGGFPEPPVAPEKCSGDACQGEASSPPAGLDVGSEDLESLGNVEPRTDCGRFERRAGRKAAQLKRARHSARRKRVRAKRALRRAERANRHGRRHLSRRARRLERRAAKAKRLASRKRKQARRAVRKAKNCQRRSAS